MGHARTKRGRLRQRSALLVQCLPPDAATAAATALGVPEQAAHMFIFYFAVLSEVSPAGA